MKHPVLILSALALFTMNTAKANQQNVPEQCPSISTAIQTVGIHNADQDQYKHWYGQIKNNNFEY